MLLATVRAVLGSLFPLVAAALTIRTVNGAGFLPPTCSSAMEGFAASGALDGDPFSIGPGTAWKGAPGENNWWWQVRFDPPRDIGAILQVVGDHEFVLRNAPKRYAWQGSREERTWFDLTETVTLNERRLFRLHRLRSAQRLRGLRLRIESATGDFPTLREVAFLADPRERIAFPDWIIVVNTTHDRTLPNHGRAFIPLAKSCAGWETLEAQQVWLDSFDKAFVAAEPRPLCAFLSGNFKDWCEVQRELWRGTQLVLENKVLPIWASCGGAQGLAILAENGVDQPWDCPHCRDELHPKTPIYTHLGHTARRPCGDYSGCLFERGPHWIRPVGNDPAFRGLPSEFQLMESHCGQIEWPPPGWKLVATAGHGTQTKNQCLRLKDRYVYAAQFHIEMEGTPEASKQIMANFLALAKESKVQSGPWTLRLPLPSAGASVVGNVK